MPQTIRSVLRDRGEWGMGAPRPSQIEQLHRAILSGLNTIGRMSAHGAERKLVTLPTDFRLLRETGHSPTEAHLRPPEVVEKYEG